MDFFQQAIKEIAEQYTTESENNGCPSRAQLYQTLDDHDNSENSKITAHIRNCTRCRLQIMCLDDREWLATRFIEQQPDKALESMLGETGRQTVSALIREREDVTKTLTAIREEAVAFISSLWQPMFAGEAVTAADLAPQSHRFDMEFGEYVSVNCSWQKEDQDTWLELGWEANIFQKSLLRVQFVNPESKAVLADIPLGTDLCGQKRLASSDLSFHPANDKWAVVVVVETL